MEGSQMRISRIAAVLALLFGMSLQARTEEKKLTVTGKLVRIMAIGAESTGWAIEADSEVTLEGKKIMAIEVSYSKTPTLEKLANQRVRARGNITHRHSVEAGDRVGWN